MSTQRLENIEPAQARELLDAGAAVLVDVRESDERAREHIADDVHAPLSSLTPEQLQAGGSKTLVFYCATGNRARDAAEGFTDHNFERVYVLQGGLAAWRKAGYSTKVNRRAPLPIMRQVQVTAGAMILTGVGLGFLISPAWFGLSAFVGAGLMFAGISGWCGMASLLAVMPWNQRERNLPPGGIAKAS